MDSAAIPADGRRHPDLVQVALYARMLDQSWGELDGAVRRAHLTGDSLVSRGWFRVVPGSSRVAPWLCKVLGFPTVSERLPTRLEIVPDGNGEKWSRRF